MRLKWGSFYEEIRNLFQHFILHMKKINTSPTSVLVPAWSHVTSYVKHDWLLKQL
jgi:hypothetical protein